MRSPGVGSDFGACPWAELRMDHIPIRICWTKRVKTPDRTHSKLTMDKSGHFDVLTFAHPLPTFARAP